jgi:hypothetical protein
MRTITAIALVTVAVAFPAVALADPDPICQQSTQFGLSPGQIADNLHSGQPNMSLFRQRGQVLNDLGNCPETEQQP